jgi:2-polyprenyl-3-methyl-5-hydroxy-6-metoxy-1,4-benzoquinol methylase
MSAPCPNCGQASSAGFRTKDRNRRTTQERFNYYCCGQCGLWFLHPVPKDLGRYYPSDYYTIPASVEQLAAALSGVRYKLELLKPFARSGRLLEIGPACGDFALQAKQAGFEVDAIEMDPRCCDFLVKQVGVRATCTADTLAALRQMGPYDVIAMWHVVEHLTDAFETLAAAAARLKPGGVVVVAAPNPEAFQFRVLRGQWTHVDAPRHVVLIPLALVVRHAQRCRLKPVFTTTDDEGARGWNEFGWTQSLTNLASRQKAKERLRRVARWITRMAAPWDRREGWGSAYTAVFRKDGGAG